MEITSDVILKGAPWYQATERLSDIFATRTNYSLFMLSAQLVSCMIKELRCLKG